MNEQEIATVFPELFQALIWQVGYRPRQQVEVGR
jgi:hypothetical protein